MFFYAISPSIFFAPNEVFITPLILNGTNLVVLVLVVGIGSFIGDIPLYYLGKYGYRLFSGKKKNIADSKHLMHKYSYIVFLAPAIPFVPSVVIEILMVVAGHQHLDIKRIFPIVFVAEMIKAGFVVATLAGLLNLSVSACI